MSMLSPWIGGTRRLVMDVGQYGLLLGPVRRALVEPASAANDDLLRLLVCHYGRRSWEAGLIAGTCGNFSARLRGRDSIYITPRGANKSRLVASDIQRVALSKKPDDLSKVSVELPMHRACYLADAAVGGVVHTHAPALTAVGIRGIDLGELLPEAAEAIGGIASIPYTPSGSNELGEAVARAVKGGAALMILERHGAVTVGRSVGEAFERMEFGELTAKAALLAAGDVAEAILPWWRLGWPVASTSRRRRPTRSTSVRDSSPAKVR